MSPGSSTESYPAFARIGLRENPGKNLNQLPKLSVTLYDVKTDPTQFSNFILMLEDPASAHEDESQAKSIQKEEERNRDSLFENKVLRKIFVAKRDEVTGEWRKLHNAELHALYSSPDIIRNIKSRRLRWPGHVARMGESRNAYVVSWEAGGKKAFGEAETCYPLEPRIKSFNVFFVRWWRWKVDSLTFQSSGENLGATALRLPCARDNAGEMSPGSNTDSYPAFAHIGLRENPGKNLNQVTCPDWDSNPGHLVSRPDALTVTPQCSAWLVGEVTFCDKGGELDPWEPGSPRVGRPRKLFTKTENKTKGNRIQSLVEENSQEELELAADNSLRASGKRDTAGILKDITKASPRRATRYKKTFKSISPT
ncbi:hypothetical protein ANN_06889 [Periplaneta americana]|uniref:Uncharacterized protein n=1 Tax=Periplaneta americana TaxID=6978 RepID=A0ABQ8TEV2_PERAM|nr:hypothetical protein ANN_06889 [Periplaneta americana]